MKEKEIFAGEVAAMLGVNRQRVNQLANQGHIGHQVGGRYWVFKPSEVERFRETWNRKPGRPKKVQPAKLSRGG
jgi:Helix-turn-helix domain